jgi:hypothetical protein
MEMDGRFDVSLGWRSGVTNPQPEKWISDVAGDPSIGVPPHGGEPITVGDITG